MTQIDSTDNYQTNVGRVLDDWANLLSIAPSQAMARADNNQKRIDLLSAVKNAHPIGRISFLTQTAAGVHDEQLRVLSETLSNHDGLKDFMTYGLTEIQTPKFAAWAYIFSKNNMIDIDQKYFHDHITAMSDRHKEFSKQRSTLYAFGATSLHALAEAIVAEDSDTLTGINQHALMIAISYKIGLDLQTRFKAGESITDDTKSPLIDAIKNDDLLNGAFSMAHRNFVHYQSTLTSDEKLNRESSLRLDKAVQDLIQDYDIIYGTKPRLIIQSDDSRTVKPSHNSDLKNA